GLQSRCFCDVRDVVPALPRLLSATECHGRVFHLGSDQPITMLALAELVARTLGSDLKPRLIPYDEAYAPGFEDLRQRRPDLRRVQSAIGFAPKLSLEQSIRDIGAELVGEKGTHAAPAPPRAAARDADTR